MAALSPRHINKQIRRNVKASIRPHERAASAIAALKAELGKRIDVLQTLSAEEERCHRETMAWMADLGRSDLPKGPSVRCDPFNFDDFAAIVDSIEAEKGWSSPTKRDDDTVVEPGLTTTMHDLARSGEFVSLVDKVAAYKTACFGCDAVTVNASVVREMILRSDEGNPEVLHVRKRFVQKSADDDTNGDLETEIDTEFTRKLNLCKFYAVDVAFPAAGHQPANRADRLVLAAETPLKVRKTEFNELERWTLANAHHPYPSTHEKETLAESLNLSVGQVQHWFSNMRKRKYFPVIDMRRPPRDDFELELLTTYKHKPPIVADDAPIHQAKGASSPPQPTPPLSAKQDEKAPPVLPHALPPPTPPPRRVREPPTSPSAGDAPPLESLPEETLFDAANIQGA